METVLIYRQTLLPLSETFIAAQAGALRSFLPRFVGLTPASRGLQLSSEPILLQQNRSFFSRIAARLYCASGKAPAFHSRASKLKPALVHAHFAPDGAAAIPLASHLKVPLVVSLHGYDITTRDEHLSRSLAGLQYLLKRKLLWERASLFICPSEFLRQIAVKVGFPKDKLRVHYIGIDCNNFTPADKPDRPMVLFIGRLVPKKGCAHLIRAMKIVQAADPSAELVVIGTGPLEASLRQLAEDLGISVRFLGAQPSSAVSTWLRKARILCIPSVTAANGDAEGLGMVILEAQATGRPVVGSRSGGIPEAVLDGETGLLAEPGNEEQLAEHISRFLHDDVFWSSASARAISWVRERFDLKVQTRELEQIYEGVCNRN